MEATIQGAILAFDIGGTRIKAGIVDGNNQILARDSIWTEGHRGIEDVVQRASQFGRSMMTDIQLSSVDGVGVACTGVIDTETGTVIQLNGKIPDIEGAALGPMFAEAFSCPSRVDNDGRTFCIGEWQGGAAKGAHDVVGMTIGTGIGSGVILNGKALRTRGHLGGILGGHLTIDPNGEWCSCGNRGCLETVGSVTALLSKVKDYVRRGHRTTLAEYVLSPEASLTGEAVLNAYRNGDEVARYAVDRWLQWLGAGAVTLIHTYDPEVLVVGGGIMQAGPEVVDAMAEYVARHAWTTPPGRVKVVSAQLRDDAALIGAAHLVRSYTELEEAE